MVADTSQLQASMLRGDQTVVEFTVTNEGAIASGELDILLPETDWLKSASQLTLPGLNPGESTNISLLLQPLESQELTVYNGNVVVAGDEASLSIPFSFRAISEATGNLDISVVNELFFFAEDSPRLENATITLLDGFTGEVIFSETDADGLLSKMNLAEGYYTLRITAENHDTYEQNILLEAGETESIQAFLSRQTVQYNWTVTPTEIEDQYTINIESVFEADVPIPTVVIEPGFIDLAELQEIGQVRQIDMTITNHGLIAANNIKLDLGDHPFYQIEPLIDGVDVLDAQSSMTIPVRITRIADFETLQNSQGEISLASTPQVPCLIPAYIYWSYLCGDIEVEKSVTLAYLNVEGNCNTVGGNIRSDSSRRSRRFGGDSNRRRLIYSSTPIIYVNDPCNTDGSGSSSRKQLLHLQQYPRTCLSCH
ncbi:MAG: hypothetical protein QNJ33_14675 [Crocosphaera sp.]|nr:hypothetical protein [Crocosphaera sp.]